MLAPTDCTGANEGLIKKNPLIENRIGLNCFDEDTSASKPVRLGTIQWRSSEDADESGSSLPLSTQLSLMYAAPLLSPLLSNAGQGYCECCVSDAIRSGEWR
jgi:hypothetical protein